jgi:hypothetical protein
MTREEMLNDLVADQNYPTIEYNFSQLEEIRKQFDKCTDEELLHEWKIRFD